MILHTKAQGVVKVCLKFGVARSSNVVDGGRWTVVVPLIEIRLTDLSKSWGDLLPKSPSGSDGPIWSGGERGEEFVE